VGEFVVTSALSAKPDVVWLHSVSPVGVNREFRPFLRMTFPPGVSDLTAGWRPGERQFRSWLLAAGLIPVEYDDVSFVEIEPGRRFLERSSMFTQRVWEHERTIEPASDGCRIRDRVRFVPRLRWLSPVHGLVFRAVFQWRHRCLRRLFGEANA
jgi:ligand-binding SRPBCC domain-containing protein